MSGGTYQELFAEIYHNTGYRATDPNGRSEHPLIFAYNRIASPLVTLLLLATGEVEELEEQQESVLSQDWWKELADILVFLRSIQERLQQSFSVEATIFSVNGQYTGKFDSMKEQLANMGSGNVEHNLKHFIAEILSMLKHLDQSTQAKVYLRVEQLIREMQLKLNGNKESRFYQLEPGMTDDEILQKYEHVTQALRILRKFLLEATGQEMALQAWITDFFKTEIEDWRDSREALSRLKAKILIFKSQLQDEVFDQLAQDPSLNPDHLFQLKLMISGAVPLTTDKSHPDPSRQTSGNSATLSTVFWF